jgi:hypothetical protein
LYPDSMGLTNGNGHDAFVGLTPPDGEKVQLLRQQVGVHQYRVTSPTNTSSQDKTCRHPYWFPKPRTNLLN